MDYDQRDRRDAPDAEMRPSPEDVPTAGRRRPTRPAAEPIGHVRPSRERRRRGAAGAGRAASAADDAAAPRSRAGRSQDAIRRLAADPRRWATSLRNGGASPHRSQADRAAGGRDARKAPADAPPPERGPSRHTASRAPRPTAPPTTRSRRGQRGGGLSGRRGCRCRRGPPSADAGPHAVPEARRRPAKAPSARAAARRTGPASPSAATAASASSPPVSRAPSNGRPRRREHMACPRCGTHNRAGVAFCQNCGANLRGTAPGYVPPAVAGPPATAAESRRQRRRGPRPGRAAHRPHRAGDGYLLPFTYGTRSLFERAFGADGTASASGPPARGRAGRQAYFGLAAPSRSWRAPALLAIAGFVRAKPGRSPSSGS